MNHLESSNNRTKKLGQVFTPKFIVQTILDSVDYVSWNILWKNIIDNSCWDWAFLKEIIHRYILEYQNKHSSLVGVETELSTFIHGIEINSETYQSCITNLNILCAEYGISWIKWDIKNENTLLNDDFYNTMDFVVWNPPYVRVHNLEQWYNDVKKYSFSQEWMTDLYIVFFEIGLKMLKPWWKMWYISPNSFYTSIAWKTLREYIKVTQSLYKIIDFWHFQLFEWATTYTTITCFQKNNKFNEVKYFSFDSQQQTILFSNNIPYQNLFIEWNLILSHSNSEFLDIYNTDISQSTISVKNGFATLSDNIFIQTEFWFSECIIPILKASTWERKQLIFPYKNGKIIDFSCLKDEKLKSYLLSHKDTLIKRNLVWNSVWYGFWRTQAISDVDTYRISINTTIKDEKSIKMFELPPGVWIYSGLYISSKYSFEELKKVLISPSFISYIQTLNKCKSWWYYTFSSKDLKKFLSYKLERNEQQWFFKDIN